MLDVWQEYVPDDCDHVDIENPEWLRNVSEVDVLRRGPDDPIKLKW